MFLFKVCYRFDPDSCEEFSLGEKRGESGTETRREQNRRKCRKERSQKKLKKWTTRGEREREREGKNFLSSSASYGGLWCLLCVLI